MNKKNFSVLLLIMFGIIFQTNFSLAQDSTKSKSSEEFTALKKGNFAIYLEFGSLLFQTGNSGIFESNYEWLLTAKYHLSERTALRISGGSTISGGSGVGNSYYYGIYDTLSPWHTSTSFITTINLQHFLSLNSKVKPFYSLGIYAKYYYSGSTDKGSWEKSEEWGIGPYVSFGAEMFILDNISIIGEYILKGTIGKKYQKGWTVDNNNYIQSQVYSYSTNYILELNTYRAGLSIYF
jgi:hypothetical protein